MAYYIDPNGNYPRHAGDIQIDFPDWIEGQSELPTGWQEVAPGAVPEGQFVEIAPAEVNGVLTRQFEVLPAPPESILEP